MNIEFKTKKREEICSNASAARRELGSAAAEKPSMGIDQMESAACWDNPMPSGIGRCRFLKGNRAGRHAMDLEHPCRPMPTAIGIPEVSCIIEIVDYH